MRAEQDQTRYNAFRVRKTSVTAPKFHTAPGHWGSFVHAGRAVTMVQLLALTLYDALVLALSLGGAGAGAIAR